MTEFATSAIFDHAAGPVAWLAINGKTTKIAIPAAFATEFNATYAGRPVKVVLRRTFSSYVRGGRHYTHAKLTLVDISLQT